MRERLLTAINEGRGAFYLVDLRGRGRRGGAVAVEVDEAT